MQLNITKELSLKGQQPLINHAVGENSFISQTKIGELPLLPLHYFHWWKTIKDHDYDFEKQTRHLK